MKKLERDLKRAHDLNLGIVRLKKRIGELEGKIAAKIAQRDARLADLKSRGIEEAERNKRVYDLGLEIVELTKEVGRLEERIAANKSEVEALGLSREAREEAERKFKAADKEYQRCMERQLPA